MPSHLTNGMIGAAHSENSMGSIIPLSVASAGPGPLLSEEHREQNGDGNQGLASGLMWSLALVPLMVPSSSLNRLL